MFRGVPRDGQRLSRGCLSGMPTKEFAIQKIEFRSQAQLHLTYKGEVLQHTYVPDFTCFEKIIVELKAVTALTVEHRAQLHNYLKATGHKLGLLVNFGHYPKVEHERIVR